VAFSGRDTATPITPTMKECFCFDSVSITFVHIAGAHAFRDQFFFGYELLSCLSMCNVGVLWSNGWMDQDATWFGGRPRPRRHCVRCKLSAPPPRKGAQRPHFRSTALARSPISATVELQILLMLMRLRLITNLQF